VSISSRIDHVTDVTSEYQAGVIPAPRSVKIELTNKCNFRCGFCALRTRETQTNEVMDLSFFRRITAEMRDAGVEEIGVFYLGESFTTPDVLVEAIRWCKRDIGMPYVFCTTNGSLAHPDVVWRCMDAGLDSLKFSVNAATPEQFREVMGVKESLFWVSLDNIRQAREVRDRNHFKCGIYASSIRYDGEQHERMRETLDKHVIPFVDEHYWLPLYAEMSSMNKQIADKLGYEPKAGNQGRLDNLRQPLPCWAVFTEGHVTVDGTLSACCFDANGKFAMGNLHDEPFMQAWNNEKFQALRIAHLAKDVTGTVCDGCIAYA
jgi:radical SAM protein with 4Fe4S-binding SPASM domain